MIPPLLFEFDRFLIVAFGLVGPSADQRNLCQDVKASGYGLGIVQTPGAIECAFGEDLGGGLVMERDVGVGHAAEPILGVAAEAAPFRTVGSLLVVFQSAFEVPQFKVGPTKISKDRSHVALHLQLAGELKS